MEYSFGHRLKVALSWAVFLPIVGLTYIIVWLDRLLQLPLGFPRNVQQLTGRTQWLLKQLQQNGALPAGATINNCEVKPLNQNIIFRSNAAVVNINYTIAGEEKQLKCFAKFAPTMGTVWNKTIFNLQLNHIKEGWFNSYFINQDALPAPRVYSSSVSPLTGQLCLITEHMGSDIEYRECAYESFPDAHLQLAIDGLAQLHAKYWGNKSASMQKVMPIADSSVYMFDSMVARTWSADARKILVKSWIYMNQQQTVLHGDSRIGNMMFPAAEGKGRFVLIDWQAVRQGVAAYDLAYFLVLSLISTHRKQAEQAAIDTYYQKLLAYGVEDYTRAQLEDDYRHGCLCTLVLLSLPMLSGEVSAEGFAAQIFVYGMGVWHKRMQIKFDEFDYNWVAQHYNMSAQQARSAVTEMLGVIEKRIEGISQASGTGISLIEVLKQNNIEHEYEV